MAVGAPGQVGFHDRPHTRFVARFELERGREHHVVADVEDRIVVAEVEIRGADGAAFVFLGQQIGLQEHLFEEHRPFAFGRRREEVQVLPQRPADGRGDADVMFEPRESRLHGPFDHVGIEDGAAFGPELARLGPHLDVLGRVADDEAAKASVADDDIGADAEQEMWDRVGARYPDGVGQFVGGVGLDEKVRRTAYFKGGIRGQDNVALEAVRAQRVAQGLPRSRIDGRNAHRRKKNGAARESNWRNELTTPVCYSKVGLPAKRYGDAQALQRASFKIPRVKER